MIVISRSLFWVMSVLGAERGIFGLWLPTLIPGLVFMGG